MIFQIQGAGMKNFLRLAIVLFACTFIAHSCQAANQKRPWTFLVYIAADNNLNPEADANIAQMVKASASSNVHILVYLNIKRKNEPKKTQRLLIKNGKIIQQGDTTVEDSGIPSTLIKALAWAATQFPSDYLLVDLWNHGSGPLNRDMLIHRGICYDDTTGHYLTDIDCKNAFDVLVNQYRAGKKIDIIAFDACLMANLEVAYTFMPYAHYMVGSQQTVPGSGFNYADVLSLFEKNIPNPAAVSSGMVSSFDNYYKRYSNISYTLSAINLDKINLCTTTTNTIATILFNLLNADQNDTVKKVIATCINPSICAHFDEYTYIDLYSFYANLYVRVNALKISSKDALQLQTALRQAMSALSAAVFANVQSPDLPKTHGLSIYFADSYYGIEPSYYQLYWSITNPYWVNFLDAFIYG